jgi:membrane protease YdiL (CAAX protease family)
MDATPVRKQIRAITHGLPPQQPRSWLPLLLVAQVWLIVNGRAVLGRQWASDVGLFYLLLILVALISAAIYAMVGNTAQRKFLTDLFRGTLREYVLKVSLGFLATLVAFWVLFLMLLPMKPSPIAYSSVWPTIVLQALFVAPAEELFFRGYMPRVFDPKAATWRIYAGVSVADAFTAAAFSSFHLAAFGVDAVGAFAIVFALAVVWLWLSRLEVGQPFHTTGKRPLGIPFTIGSHLAWNLCALGILTGGVLVGA